MINASHVNDGEIVTEIEYAPAVMVSVFVVAALDTVGIDNVADELVTVILPDSELPFISALVTPVMV